MIPLMSITRNFFMGREPARGRGPLGRFDVGERQPDRRGRDGQDRHRRARPDPGGRHALGRRAPVRRDRARGLFRRPRADPRRADLGARRQAGLGRAALRRPGARARPRRDLHHPQRPPRLSGRRRLHDPQSRPHLRHLPEERRVARGGAQHDGRRQGAGRALGRARGVLAHRRRSPARASARSPRSCTARPNPSTAHEARQAFWQSLKTTRRRSATDALCNLLEITQRDTDA